MAIYTFTFKKDDVFVDFTTTDKELMERQFRIWVTCASVYAYNQEKREKGLLADNPPKVESKKEIKVEPAVEAVSTKNDSRAIGEPEPSTEVEKPIEELKQDFADSIDEGKNSQNEKSLDKIYGTTINDIQNSLSNLKQEADKPEKPVEQPKEEPKVQAENLESKEDFDKMLERAMTETEYISEVKKDDKFLKVLRVKNASEKIDYLIITAYYLSEFENLAGFTLKQINAKLMENINEVIDHGVLQDAKDLGYVELIPNSTNITSGAEYRLTEEGEKAFLNGRG